MPGTESLVCWNSEINLRLISPNVCNLNATYNSYIIMIFICSNKLL